MRVRMRLAGWVVRQMLVLMMRIVHVSMCVLHRLVLVLMFVMLGQVQPDAHAHQETGRDELHGQRLAKEQDGRDGAQEWRSREVGTCPRSTELPQSQARTAPG